MAPRLRPEVIIPLRTSGSWVRTMLLGCCAFIMFVTMVDAMRYAAHRDARAREAAIRQQIQQLQKATREAEARMKALSLPATPLCASKGRPGPTCFATSPEPR